MATKDDEIRAAMQELRKEYLVELPEHLHELEGAISAARSHAAPEAMRHAISRAHMIRGTAGSYRFMEISEAAGHIEDGLSGISAGWLPPEQGWPEIERALSAAQAALVAASSEG
jgi:chemotaxis protein histidine kinase CheA